MNLKKIKNYLIFILSILCFAITIIYSLNIYLNWDKVIQDEEILEVSLPIMDWNKYSNLSKQY